MKRSIKAMVAHARSPAISSEEVTTKYDIKHVLGTGATGEVRLAVNKKTGEEVAIKIMPIKNEQSMEKILKEVDIIAKLRHPNIVKFIEMFTTNTPKERKIYMVTELVTGGELFDRIVDRGSFSEPEARDVARTVLEALHYMHTHGIVHRDLKPENLLYEHEGQDSKVKVADFGLAKVYTSKAKLKTVCGTPTYVAPEILWSVEESAQGYGPEVDMWSVGVITYVLLCGYPPFYEKNQRILFRRIIEADYDFPSPEWDNISPAAKQFVGSLLKVEPEERPSPEDALMHEWMLSDSKQLSLSKANMKRLKDYYSKYKQDKGRERQTQAKQPQVRRAAGTATATTSANVTVIPAPKYDNDPEDNNNNIANEPEAPDSPSSAAVS